MAPRSLPPPGSATAIPPAQKLRRLRELVLTLVIQILRSSIWCLSSQERLYLLDTVHQHALHNIADYSSPILAPPGHPLHTSHNSICDLQHTINKSKNTTLCLEILIASNFVPQPLERWSSILNSWILPETYSGSIASHEMSVYFSERP